MLNREYTPKETLQLWDAVFANDFRSTHYLKEKKEKVGNEFFELFDFICLAMIIRVREKCNLYN